MSVRWSRTMLIRLMAEDGTYMLTVFPAPTLKALNELNALLPVCVAVETLYVLPALPTVVCVRPSGRMTVCARAKGGHATPNKAINASAMRHHCANADCALPTNEPLDLTAVSAFSPTTTRH